MHHDSNLLVCGATFAGLGAALAAQAAGRNVILIERSALLGSEFIEAFQCRRAEWLPRTESGRWLHQHMMERGIIGQDGCSVYLAALHPLLCLLVRQQRLQVRMLTEIVEIGREKGQYHVELHDIRGRSTIQAEEILDTSTMRLTCPGELFTPESKSIHAYLYHPAGIEWEGDSNEQTCLSFTTRLRPFQATLQMAVSAKDSWSDARQRLHRCWADRPTAWRAWTIAAIAGGFAAQVPAGVQRLATGWNWLPSEAYANPLDALDHGYEYGAKEWGQHAASNL